MFLQLSCSDGDSIGALDMHNVNWEKFGVYVAVITAFIIIVAYIADIKERTAKLEVKIEKTEELLRNGK